MIPVVAVTLPFGEEGERKILLEMTGTLGGYPSVGNMHGSLSSTTQLFLILTCYHKDRIFGLSLFSVDKQNK